MRKRNSLKRAFSAGIVVLAVVVSGASAKAQSIAPAVSRASMDLTVNPGDDFATYCNGNWRKSHPISSDRVSFGALDELSDANRVALREIVESTSKNTQIVKGSNAQKIRDFYISGMDTALIEKLSYSPIKPYLQNIESMKTIADVQKEVVKLMMMDIFPLFNMYASADQKNSEMMCARMAQGGLSLPERDYYLNQDKASQDIRAEYIKHIAKMFELTDVPAKKAAKYAQIVFDIELQFAKASNSRVENRDPNKTYNKMTIQELSALCPAWNWSDFNKSIGQPELKDVVVAQPNFFKEFSNTLKSISVKEWRVFLKWKLINSTSNCLSSSFVKERFNFFNKFLYGQKEMKPRWKTVLDNVNSNLGEALGELYVEKYFPPQAKLRMMELVMNLKKAFRIRIENASWMNPNTKKEAIEKLERMNTKIGYPDKWRDYSALDIIPNSYLENVLRTGAYEVADNYAKIGKPVDKTEWSMSPQTVNAYFNGVNNEIVFPAGILQLPLFDLNADDASNYGAIGVIIGHEMTHGFDDKGRKSDKFGNLRDWWTKEDADEFTKRAQVLVDQFDNIVAIDSMHLDGKLTIGENIADLGGLTIAWTAFQMTQQAQENKDLDGFSASQRFFISYGNVWRKNILDKALMRQVKEDVHSPAQFRINGIVYHMPQFYQSFPTIKATDKLFIAPEKRAVIW